MTNAGATIGQDSQSFLAHFGTVRNLATIAFLISALVMLAHRPFRQGEGGDTAIYDYIAQSVVRGQLPYRDIVDIKWPGAVHLSALAIVIGKPLGIRDVIAVRLLNIILVGLLSVLMFLVAEAYLRNRNAAVIAFLLPLMEPRFIDWMVVGTEPKLPLMVFGMLSLLLIIKDRPFWAGVCSMLACLCWQPGLMFTGTAVLMFSRYLTTWRDLRAIKTMIGAILPLALAFFYFYARGAFGDLWAWTITYNYGVFGPDANRGPADALAHIWKVMNRILQADVLLVIFSVFGLLLFGAERVRARIRGETLRSPDLFREAILFPPIVYFAFCLINFQAGPDLIPFIPFIALFAAKFFLDAGRLVRSKIKWLKLRPEAPVARIAIVVILLVTFVRAALYKFEGPTLKQQDEAFKTVSQMIGANDKIYVHGMTEILVLLNRPNLNPYVFLDWGADEFAASRKGEQFEAIIDEMETQAPKIVALSRLKVVTHRDEFKRWAEAHYDKLELPLPGYDGVYVRKP
jgi:hypothetical protein